MERALRQSLMMSQGDLSIFITRPLAVAMLLLTPVIVSMPLLRKVKVWRLKTADQEA
jgi:TctA family transporter